MIITTQKNSIFRTTLVSCVVGNRPRWLLSASSTERVTGGEKLVSHSKAGCLRLSCKIQPFKNSYWKSTLWRCEQYLINWQKYFHSVHTAQPTEWSIICICIISVTGNWFCPRSTCKPPSCLQFYQMFTDLKSFFTDRLSSKFVKKIWLLKISPHLKFLGTLPCDLSLITTLVWECRLFSDIDVFKVV